MTEPNKRKSRHRQTETLRRQRIRTALDGLRRELRIDKDVDQATILETALQYIQSLQAQAASSSRADTCIQGPNTLETPQFSASDVLTMLSDAIQRQSSHQQTSFQPSSTLHVASSASSPQQENLALPLSSSPALLLSTDVEMEELSSSMLNISLDSFYLPTSIGLSLTVVGRVLDANQAKLSFYGAADVEQINRTYTSTNPNELCVMSFDTASVVIGCHQSDALTVSHLWPLRMSDGSQRWVYVTCNRLIGHISNQQQLWVAISQPSPPPDDFRPRVWLEGQQIFAGAPCWTV